MPTKDPARKAIYDKENFKRYGIKLHVRIDADLIAHLENQKSIQGYLKQLIRDDIARSAAEPTEPKAMDRKALRAATTNAMELLYKLAESYDEPE